MSDLLKSALADLQGDLLPALDAFVEASRQMAKERATAPLVDALEVELGKAFRAQGRALLSAMRDYADQFPVEESLTERQWLLVFGQASEETLALFSEPLLKAVRAALQSGGDQTIASMGVTDIAFNLANPGAVAYLDRVGAARIRGIDDETRRVIKGILDKGAREGWSYDHVASEIRDQFDIFAVGKPQAHIRSRAHLVAVTEIGDAYEEASLLAAGDLQEAGLPMEKSWDTVGDANVSDGCRANEADGWIPINQAHSSGHQKPLRFPGCRCTEKYRRVQN